MSKLSFKRIALAVVVAMGVGLLGGSSAKAVVINHTLTIDAATDTASVNDTAVAYLTHTFGGTSAPGNKLTNDSATVFYTCEAPTGSTCPAIKAYNSPTSDTSGVNAHMDDRYTDISSSGYTDSVTATSTTARNTFMVKAESFTKAGTYIYRFYATAATSNSANSTNVNVSGSSAPTWTVTVTAPDRVGVALDKSYISSDQVTAANARRAFQSSTDSAVVADKGVSGTQTAVAYAFAVVKNAAGDTRVASGTSYEPVQDTLSVTITGGGTIAAWSSASAPTSGSVSATIQAVNRGDLAYASETLVVFSNGNAGTGTITWKNSAGTTIGTQTVTFTGDPYTFSIGLSDTTTVKGTSVNIVGTAKDSNGNVVKSGKVYVYSSDTAVAGSFQSTAYAAGAYSLNTGCTIADTGVFTCSVVTTETGTATLYVRESNTVTASARVSSGLDLTVLGSAVAKSYTIAFDKTSYNIGQLAVLTITGKDVNDRPLATNSATITSMTATAGSTLQTSAPNVGTLTSLASLTSTTFTGYNASGWNDSGVETRVVLMPSTPGTFTVTLKYRPFGTATTAADTVLTASATVVDPLEAVLTAKIAEAQAAATSATTAAKAEATAAIAAADAATDAALQAIDAANAATDAANLAAEAADAATVAAEEAKDAADAATAAVEALATQVATLMAALQAQVRSLANTVAKIAKKVKA